jgi:cellulose synthase/poly-beta-1,6-N-acetylglucosamine synthase-like glycosyltransferase
VAKLVEVIVYGTSESDGEAKFWRRHLRRIAWKGSPLIVRGECHRLQVPAMIMDASRPRISVITPSLSQAAFIEQTISSVLDQNYPNLEYIIVDGGSTVGSIGIILKYESRLRIRKKDRRSLGRDTGDIIAYLNSDDFLGKHRKVFSVNAANKAKAVLARSGQAR